MSVKGSIKKLSDAMDAMRNIWLAVSPARNLGNDTVFIGGPGSAAGIVASMMTRAGTGRALAAPRTRGIAAPHVQRSKRRPSGSQLEGRRLTPPVNRPALSQYWWATHLRQLRSTSAPTRKKANDNRQLQSRSKGELKWE